MQSTQQLQSLERTLTAIANKTDLKALKVLRENATKQNVPEVVAACDRRFAELAASAKAARRKAANAGAKAAETPHGIRYRGAFRIQLTERLRGEPDRCLLVWLPLAKETGGRDRGRVAGAIRLDACNQIVVEDLDRETQHSSLSNLRANYEAEGGGTNSWGRFETADGTSIAKYLNVDPALAHDSLGE